MSSSPSSSRSVALLRDLIAHPTVSRDSNLALILHVRDLLAAHGIASTLVPDASGTKANLYASVGPADRPGVVLSGHTDVVPVEGQAWTVEPFRATERDGRVYGRGASDMKGFVACAVDAMIRAASRPLARPLQLALSYDEEIGCVGVRRLLDVMEGFLVKPLYVVVGEPTSMRVASGHKGKTAMHVCCHGLEAHSSQAPTSVNAIHLATDLIGEIRRQQAVLAAREGQDDAYAIPYTTWHVGTIHGGTALNIVPNLCELDVEVRHLPADDPEALLGQLREAADRIVAEARPRFGGAAIEWNVLSAYPGLDTPADDAVWAMLDPVLPSAERIKMDFGTEGGLFRRRLGVPVIVCGPGSIAQAHKPDEYVEVEQLAMCDRFLDAVTQQLL